MASMVWEVAGSLMVLRENGQTPSDAEWDHFLVSVMDSQRRHGALRMLVVTDGGGPSTDQRTRLKTALKGKTVRSAVVSDAIKIRFIASAIMLINKEHGSFTRREVEGAYAHLSLTTDERRFTIDALARLEEHIKRAIPA
jgi:hypothetical protein